MRLSFKSALLMLLPMVISDCSATSHNNLHNVIPAVTLAPVTTSSSSPTIAPLQKSFQTILPGSTMMKNHALTVSFSSKQNKPFPASASRTPSFAPITNDVPTTVSENEEGNAGAWVLADSEGNATWENGALATLIVDEWSAKSVMIERTDLPTSVSSGMTALYSGEIQGNAVSGTVTWNWPAHSGYPTTGPWSASWPTASPSP